MHNLVQTLLPRLEQHRLDGLDAGPQALYPAYDGYSVANIPASICRWLDAPVLGGAPLGPEIHNALRGSYRHVILLVVDGLGLNMLLPALDNSTAQPDFAVWSELAGSGMLAPLTSIAPSTTAAAITTFWTGATPSAHGIVGYEVWLKEYGVIANMILHSPASFYGDVGGLRKGGFDPLTFLPVPTLGAHLAHHGVKSYAFQHTAIARSGLSTMLQPGAEITPFRSLSDLWVTLARLLDERADETSYSYIYWSDLDEHSHRFGPDDERVTLEFASFSRQLARFVESRRTRSRGDTLLLVTADHGHIFTPRLPKYELRNHPDLLDCLTMLPSGEARLPFVYLRPGREERFLRYLDAAWPGEFLAVPSEKVIQAGLFGANQYGRLPERVGDYVIFPQGDAYWWFADRENPLLGRHGGLSKTEMLVPLIASVL